MKFVMRYFQKDILLLVKVLINKNVKNKNGLQRILQMEIIEYKQEVLMKIINQKLIFKLTENLFSKINYKLNQTCKMKLV